MTREEFNARVMEQYKVFEEKEMAKSPVQIFLDPYVISKTVALKDYLTEEMDEFIERCYPFADTILNDLCCFEWNYDTAQWTTWEDISNMVREFIKYQEATK